MKIYAPNKQANGVYASVMFVDGVGETDNPKLIEWFQSHGYKVVDESRVATVEKSLEKGDEFIEKLLEKCDEPDFEAMTPNELREWMRKHGYSSKIKNTRNKEKLLEILRG
jgi:phage antirepressor YoqD-like protein